jgi:hypothetical protein
MNTPPANRFVIGLRAMCLATAGGLLLSLGTEASEWPVRDEYAYGFPLQAAAETDFFTADLGPDVYRSVTDPQLRDVGVYNAGGHPVPRLIERPPAAAEGEEQEVELGLIPLFGERAEPSEQLRLLLLREPEKTRLELDAAPAGGHGELQALTGYLVDTRGTEQPLQALTLTWPPLAEGFIGTVRLDASDDLQNWHHVATSALADLQFEETHVEQRRLALTPGVSGYLRISWREMPEGWRLRSVRGVYAGPSMPVNRAWLELEAEPGLNGYAGHAGEILFEAGGYLPVDRVNLLFPEGNVVVRAGIYYRPPGQDVWRKAHSGTFYRLSRRESNVQSPAAAVGRRGGGPVRAGTWQVRIESGVTSGPVRLQLGWRPDRVLFLAQGAPPFELVSGRALDALQQFPQERILGDRSLFEMLSNRQEAGRATLGERFVIAGEAGMLPSETVAVKTLLVWSGLIAAVAVVAWLVYALVRENPSAGLE